MHPGFCPGHTQYLVNSYSSFKTQLWHRFFWNAFLNLLSLLGSPKQWFL